MALRSRPARLDERAIGLTGALTLSAWVVGLGLLSRFGWGRDVRDLIADLYLGYDESATGLAIGGAWALVDGFVAGYAFAWLYNRLARRRSRPERREQQLSSLPA